jgi:3-oxoacyl-[acyl-carrier-protein] synthase II
MERRVVITGLGAISPVGNTIADFWESLKSGKSGLNFIQGFDDVDLPVRIVAQVKDFDPIANGLERTDIRKMDLYCQYAIAAANQAVKDSGLVSGENIEAVQMLPGYTHNIINLSDTEDLVTVMWCNECFDPNRPDTFFEPVVK